MLVLKKDIREFFLVSWAFTEELSKEHSDVPA